MRLLALALAISLGWQDPPKKEEPKQEGPDEFLAVTHVKILTITKGEIDGGTILIKNGKIAEVGKEVKIPEGATVVEGKGLVAMPGFIDAYSRSWVPGGSGGGSTPQVMAYDDLNPTNQRYKRIAQTGFTTVSEYPPGGTISGQGVVFKLNGGSKESMVVAKSAYLRLLAEMNTMGKETLKRELENAKKAIEAEKKAEEEKKKAEEEKKKQQSQPGTQPGTGAQTQPTQTPTQPPPQKPDERTQILMRFLRGELPGIADASSPAQILHLEQVLKGFEDYKFHLALACGPDVYKNSENLGKRKSAVLIRAQIAYLPYTRDRVNTAAELAHAGSKVVLLPSIDHLPEPFLFDVAQLVKQGFDRDAAIKSFTLYAAEVLGLDKRLGSIEVGKDGDIVLLTGDPFSALTHVQGVIINGQVVYERKGE